MGEFGNQFGEDRYNRIIDILQQALYWKFDDDATKGWVLTALTKLARGPPSGKLRETISKFSASRSEDIQ